MQGQGWRNLSFGETSLCVSVLLLVVLTQQRPLPLSEEQGKKQGRDVREHKLSGIRGLGCSCMGRRRSGARRAAGEVPTAAETRGRRSQGGSRASAQPACCFSKNIG